MEKMVPTNICSWIINNQILPKTYNNLPPQLPKIAQFTLKQSTKFSDKIMINSVYNSDSHKTTLKQDLPIQTIKNHKLSILPIRQNIKSRQTTHTTIHTKSKTSSKSLKDDNYLPSQIKLKLVPLQTFNIQSFLQIKQENQVQQKLRQRKIHQQFLRSKYLQNVKQQQQIKKKKITTNFNLKVDNKKNNDMIIYDYHGNVIPNNLKIEGNNKNYQSHYIDLEINIHNNQSIKENIQKNKLVKNKTMTQNTVNSIQKFESLKKVESIFLRDVQNIRLSQGVQLKQTRQQCRKILGYQNNQTSTKKYVDLLKVNDKPIKLKFQDLEYIKSKISSGEQPGQSQHIIKSKQSCKKFNILNDKSVGIQSNKNKQIKISNTRGIQLLMNQWVDQQDTYVPQQPQQSQLVTKKTLKKTRFNL